MKNIIFLSLLAITLPSWAQKPTNERTSILAEIEKNNTTLAALRQKAVTEKQQNTMDNALADPTVEFSNSWGTRSGSVIKQNFSIEQELDWGTISGLRRNTSESENKIVDLNYLVERQVILAEADQLLVDLIYNNALYEEMSYREMRASDLRKLYEKKFFAGDANQLEVNKVRLNHTAIVAELRRVQAQGEEIREDLQRLNGNHPITVTSTAYGRSTLPPLTELLQHTATRVPQMVKLQSTIEKEERKLKLRKAEGIPALSIGYAGEVAKGDNTNGITFGLSIPLWGNSRRKVAQQRSALTLAELEKTDVETQIKGTITRQYKNALQLCQIANQFRKELSENQDLSILDKALSLGQLSLIDYLNEITFYYSARTQALEADHKSQLAVSKLQTWFR